MRNVKYTVMDPVEVSEKRYAVTVRYEPVIDPVAILAYNEEYFEKADEVHLDQLSDAEYYTEHIAILTQIYSEYCDQVLYGNEKSFVVYYQKQPDGTYGFSENDGLLIGQEFAAFVRE